MELLTKQVFLEWFRKTQTANLGIALVCFSMGFFSFYFLFIHIYIYIFKPAVIDIWFSDCRVGAVPIPLSLLSCRSMPL